MEVQFTREQEARLGQIASAEGVAPASLVQNAALLLLEDDERFRVGVRTGIEQADQGCLSKRLRWMLASRVCSAFDKAALDSGGGERS
jgi:hypothetical protein